jgi:hypothetical protein
MFFYGRMASVPVFGPRLFGLVTAEAVVAGLVDADDRATLEAAAAGLRTLEKGGGRFFPALCVFLPRPKMLHETRVCRW